MAIVTKRVAAGIQPPGWGLRCNACGFETGPGSYPAGCPRCLERGRVRALVVAYDEVGPLGPAERSADGIWKHRGLLPRIGRRFQRTLGEGDTPLIQVPALAELTGNDRIYLKLELSNPTAAHKDRFHAVAVAVGKALGFKGVVSYSTGNHGLSMSSYAAAHRMPAVVVGNPGMPDLVQRAIRFAGGLPLLAPEAIGGKLLDRLVDDGWYPATTSWPIDAANHYGIEGYKTIGYELYQQLGRMPDLFFAPVAAGDGIVGLDRAIADLRRLGLPNVDSRLCPCQPATAAPLINALEKGLPEVEWLPEASSRALSIGDPISGGLALDAVRRSDGFGVAVTDDAIMAAGRLLAANGLLVEPSSAASVAGAIQAMRERPDLRDRLSVCLITSSGLKWLDHYAEDRPLPGGIPVSSLDAALSDVDRYVSQLDVGS